MPKEHRARAINRPQTWESMKVAEGGDNKPHSYRESDKLSKVFAIKQNKIQIYSGLVRYDKNMLLNYMDYVNPGSGHPLHAGCFQPLARPGLEVFDFDLINHIIYL